MTFWLKVHLETRIQDYRGTIPDNVTLKTNLGQAWSRMWFYVEENGDMVYFNGDGGCVVQLTWNEFQGAARGLSADLVDQSDQDTEALENMLEERPEFSSIFEYRP